MTSPEPPWARCPYCLEILAAEQLGALAPRFPKHRGHGRLRCAGWGLPIVEADYVTEEEAS